MSDDSVIKPFLIANKAEVTSMCITEYDEERAFAQQREEGRQEGKQEGIKIGELRMLVNLVRQNILTLAQAAAQAHMTVSEFEAQIGSIL